MKFTHQPVISSQIESIAHHPESNTLEVIFKGGGTYRYADVPLEVHAGMMGADSAGKYFAANIKGKYAYKKI